MKRKSQKTQRKQRRNQQQNQRNLSEGYVICGRNTVLDALKLGNILKVYVSKTADKKEKIDDILDSAKSQHIKIEFVDRKEIDRLSGHFQNNQGVAALCKKTKKLEFVDFLHKVENKKNVCFVLLTDMEYEQNLGAILRTLDASGVDGVVLSNRIKNQDSMVVKRISMGASESVPMFSQNIFIASRVLKENGYKILGVESTGKGLYINEDFSGKIALIFGGEDKGLSDPVTDVCDEVVSIPMKGYVTSLNVSVSVGVVVYERLRQIINKESI